MIDKNLMFCQLKVENQDAFFVEISHLLEETGIVKAGFSDALKLREANFPTGLPVTGGVAIPHTDGALVIEDRLVFVTLHEPIAFNEMGGDEDDKIAVKLIILLAIGNGKKHLDVLQKVITGIQNPNFVNGMLHAESQDQMYEIVENELMCIVR
ncbi:PTS sugar transporter subunit IIA [Pseudolactococcus yaeyamensis]